MSEAVEFVASIPPIQSAIKIDGQGGARIQLDVPENEMGNFIKVMMWRGMRLKISVEPIPESLTNFDNETRKGAETRVSKVGRRRA